jgi:alkyl hydroperoxide reductase subunit AhpC
VLGISCDSAYTLRAWDRELGGLDFPLCSDCWPHGGVTRAYGVFNEEIGRPDRSIFIVDREGVVRYIDIHTLREMPDPVEIEEELAKLA